ncbi:MAG: TRAP transporter substrate-binding protein [Alphaproteobacteria bacterium]
MSKRTPSDAKSKMPSRRRFLTTAAASAAGGAALLAMPQVSRAQTITWKFQSTWPTKDIFHENAADYVKRVNEMSGGRLKLDLLPAGAVVGAFQVQDACHSGVLDGAHGVTAYWYGKNKAASLFGTPPAWGWDAHMMLGWQHYGGGNELYNELVQQILKLNVVGFLTGPMPTQPLGWFKKEVKGPDDLKNIKYRTVGLSADVFKELGAAVTIVAGGEIVPAMDRGLLDAAEFNNPSSDLLLGFPDVSKVYMVQSYHQAAECFEISFSKAKFDALPAELKAILKYASEAASSDMLWKAQDRYSKDMAEIKKRGVKVYKTPKSVLEAQLKAWSTVVAKQSGENAFFKKVCDSQRAWVQRVTPFFDEFQVENTMAFDHNFKK